LVFGLGVGLILTRHGHLTIVETDDSSSDDLSAETCLPKLPAFTGAA